MALYVALFFIPSIVILTVHAFRTVSADPYWVWQETPDWHTAHDGHNLVLDLKMRFAKPLQIVTRPDEHVIIGSSRVYRGFDTRELPSTYNFGISSLRITEAQIYIEYLSKLPRMRSIIWMQDFFAFDPEVAVESGFPMGLKRPAFWLQGVYQSTLSRSAWHDSEVVLGGAQSGDGSWDVSGFKQTNYRSADAMTAVLESAYAELTIPTEDGYRKFTSALRYAMNSGLKVAVVLPPLNKSMWDELESVGGSVIYDGWRRKLCTIANDLGIHCFDFTRDHQYWDVDFSNGSSREWIDPLHFSPILGKQMLEQIREEF